MNQEVLDEKSNATLQMQVLNIGGEISVTKYQGVESKEMP